MVVITYYCYFVAIQVCKDIIPQKDGTFNDDFINPQTKTEVSKIHKISDSTYSANTFVNIKFRLFVWGFFFSHQQKDDFI